MVVLIGQLWIVGIGDCCCAYTEMAAFGRWIWAVNPLPTASVG